jgi:hypothetical protein
MADGTLVLLTMQYNRLQDCTQPFRLPFLFRWNIMQLMKTLPIARFEEIVQSLVEGTFARLFAGRLRPLEVANALANAMEDHAVVGRDDLLQAPNHYWVTLNPDDHRAVLELQPDLADDLAQHLVDLAQQAGLMLSEPPRVTLRSAEDVSARQVQVEARWLPPDDALADETASRTQQMKPVAGSVTGTDPQGSASVHTRPFLILEGQRHVALDSPTVALGRSFDNDIILDDARVSRYHAQLRQRYGRYVVYDLGSTGGTTVNGYPIQECVLEAGDVISLAGVEIIYGEDTPAGRPPIRGTGGTPPLRRPSLPETGQMPSVPPGPSET